MKKETSLLAGLLVLMMGGMAWSGIGGVIATENGYTYAVHSIDTTTATTVLTYNGLGNSWAIAVEGGEATFTVNGSSPTIVRDGKSISGDFVNWPSNPTLSLTNITGGTATLIIDGGVL